MTDDQQPVSQSPGVTLMSLTWWHWPYSHVKLTDIPQSTLKLKPRNLIPQAINFQFSQFLIHHLDFRIASSFSVVSVIWIWSHIRQHVVHARHICCLCLWSSHQWGIYILCRNIFMFLVKYQEENNWALTFCVGLCLPVNYAIILRLFFFVLWVYFSLVVSCNPAVLKYCISFLALYFYVFHDEIAHFASIKFH